MSFGSGKFFLHIPELTGGLKYHPFNKVYSVYLLRYSVLNLKSCIDLKEIELFAALVVEKFHSSGASVACGAGKILRGPEHFFLYFLLDVWSGSFFNDFLIASLNGAVPFSYCYNFPVFVSEYLHLDMPSSFYIFFYKCSAVSEVRSGKMTNSVKAVSEFFGAAAYSHADAASSGSAFQYYRIAYPVGGLDRFFAAFDKRSSLKKWNTGFKSQLSCGMLKTKELYMLAFRPDKNNTVVLASFREIRILAQKSVAGVYGLSARVKSGLDYFIKIQITVLRRAVAYQNSFIGVFHMK